MTAESAQRRERQSVQSLYRAFAILEAMADARGALTLSKLREQTGLPLATIHRLVGTLVDLGYARREPSREYSLGPRLMRLTEGTADRLGPLVEPYLRRVVEALGESVNLAALDGDEVVYVGQAQPSLNFLRIFTEVGRRAAAHTTAAGKAMLAAQADTEVLDLLQRTGMAKRTEYTITDPGAFLADLARVREQAYALDNEEQELGVRCVATAVPDGPRPMALSVSGPLSRMSDDLVARAVPLLHRAAAGISAELGGVALSASSTA